MAWFIIIIELTLATTRGRHYYSTLDWFPGFSIYEAHENPNPGSMTDMESGSRNNVFFLILKG